MTAWSSIIEMRRTERGKRSGHDVKRPARSRYVLVEPPRGAAGSEEELFALRESMCVFLPVRTLTYGDAPELSLPDTRGLWADLNLWKDTGCHPPRYFGEWMTSILSFGSCAHISCSVPDE